jgi:hypothetical protein
MDVLRHRVAITAGAGEKTSERSSRKSLMNCLCRENENEERLGVPLSQTQIHLLKETGRRKPSRSCFRLF